MLPFFALLPAPEAEYLNLDELRKWLQLNDVKTVRRYIAAGYIPNGKRRAGMARLYWGKTEAAIAKWNLDNLERYAFGVESAPKAGPESEKSAGIKQGMPPQKGG